MDAWNENQNSASGDRSPGTCKEYDKQDPG